MYRVIMLSILAIALSSCSSIDKVASAFTKEAEYRDAFPEYTKSSFMTEYALSEDEYNEWREIISSEAHDLFTSNGAEPPAWQNGNQLYLKNNSRRVITIPQSEIEQIQLALTLNDDPKAGMLLLGDDGIYTVAYFSTEVVHINSSGFASYEYNADGSYKYETIFKCYHFKFESLLKANSELLGKAGRTLVEKSRQYLEPKMERKEQEEKRLAEEAERLKKEKFEKTLSEIRQSTKEQALRIISNIQKRQINTLQLRELYVGMPADECATLLNYYLGLPSVASQRYYEFKDGSMEVIELKQPTNEDEATLNFVISLTVAPNTPKQDVENGKVTTLRFSTQMIDTIFNASSLEAKEFAQAMVDNNPLVPTLTFAELKRLYQYDPAYGWQYSDQNIGFRITILENKTMTIEKIATNSDLTL